MNDDTPIESDFSFENSTNDFRSIFDYATKQSAHIRSDIFGKYRINRL